MFFESIKMSWSNIIHNKMRSFLTVLGVLIGVSAIIALVSIVEGVSQDITNQITGLGADRISVQVKGTTLKGGLSEDNLADLQGLENIAGISVSVSDRTSVSADGGVVGNTLIEGTNEVFFENTDEVVSQGRPLTSIDVANNSNVCVIGADLQSQLFPGENPIGQHVMINGISYTVVGTLEATSGFTQGNIGTVLIP